jgi:SH3-like domain-containing protein
MLDGRRTVIITGNMRTLRLEADVKSAPVAQLETGVVVRLLECPRGNSWCKVETEGHEGWLRRVEFWGVQRNEIIK